MRTREFFRKLLVCIVEDDIDKRKCLVRNLKSLNIKEFIYYSTFESTLKDFDKFYNTHLPDIIITRWSISLWMGGRILDMYKHSKLYNTPMLIIADFNEISGNTIREIGPTVEPLSAEYTDATGLEKGIRLICNKKIHPPK